MMIPPLVRYILLTIACVVMVAAVIWIGRHMVADLSDMLEPDDDEKKKAD